MADVYLDTLTSQDISSILDQDKVLKGFTETLLSRSLDSEERAKRVQEDPELIRTALKLYLAIYLPGEINDYVNATVVQKSKSLAEKVSPETLKTMASTAVDYVNQPGTPTKPPVETLSLLMTTMMRRVGVVS